LREPEAAAAVGRLPPWQQQRGRRCAMLLATTPWFREKNEDGFPALTSKGPDTMCFHGLSAVLGVSLSDKKGFRVHVHDAQVPGGVKVSLYGVPPCYDDDIEFHVNLKVGACTVAHEFMCEFVRANESIRRLVEDLPTRETPLRLWLVTEVDEQGTEEEET
jgi:hypothetical protein